MPEEQAAAPTVGRPRLYDDATERAMLVDAAVRVMERTGSISVAAVLRESGLSTRALYRHFQSKEELLDTIMFREAEAVGRSLRRAVSRAPDPVSAVQACVERFLDVFYEPRRAARAKTLASAASQVSRPSGDMITRMRRISCDPLVDALRAGHDAGVLYSPTPEADAATIYNLVAVPAETAEITSRAAAREHVMRFRVARAAPPRRRVTIADPLG